MISQTGRVYGGRYHIERPIASGGMAQVFEARDDMLQRNVALKLMHPEYARDSTFINRFRREAQAAASLNDPRVVAIYDWGSDDGAYYIVMEYVDGKTLREIIETEGPLSPEAAARIASDICGGLALAHAKGIIHRDMKSANVAVTRSGQTKIMDFGIARAASGTDGGQTMTQTGMVIGTANYFSPEQAQGMPVDERSDIYSVGVILYEMLTRQLPFQGDSPVAIAYKHVQEDPVPPGQLNPDVPAALDAIVMKTLAKNPDNRYGSADEMRMDLQRLLDGEQVEATPILPPDQTAVFQPADRTTVLPAPMPDRGSRRRRTFAYLLSFLFIVSVLAAAAMFLFSLVDNASEPTVAVPNVAGRSLVDAQRVLDAQGLQSRIERSEFSDTVPEDFVITQDPEEGTKAPPGTRVNLVVSRGKEAVPVPDLIGKTREEAVRLLQEAGLELGNVSDRFDNTVETGRILDQDPNAGQTLTRGGAVDIVLSKGQSLARVPDVVGLTADEARARLTDAGLRPSVRTVCQDGQEMDRVISQDPPARQEVPEGTTVTISVNSAATVPSVVGDTEEEATRKLREQGFRVSVQRSNAFVGTNQVIQQDPNPGQSACSGQTITITIL